LYRTKAEKCTMQGSSGVTKDQGVRQPTTKLAAKKEGKEHRWHQRGERKLALSGGRTGE